MNKKKVWITVLVCIAAVLALVAALRVAGGQAAAEPEDNTITVETITPQRADLANQMDFIGSLTAGNSVAVMPNFNDIVDEIQVKPGDEVKVGDVLFVQDGSKYEWGLQQAANSLEVGMTQVEANELYGLDAAEDTAYVTYDAARDAYKIAKDAYDKANDSQAIAAMKTKIAEEKVIFESWANTTEAWAGMTPEKAEATAQKNYEAASKAWRDKGAPDSGDELVAVQAAESARAELLDKTQAYNAAVAALDNFNDALAILESQLIMARSTKNSTKIAYDNASGSARELSQKELDLKRNELQLQYQSYLDTMKDLTVTAPVAGKVLSVDIQQNNMALTSQVAVVIGSEDSMKVTFGLPANYFGQVQVGDRALVQATGGSTQATVTEVAQMLGANGTFEVTAEFANTQGFLSGGTAKVTLTTQHAENVLTVPVDCVRYENNIPYVYVLRDGVAVKTTLTLGMTDEEVYEVVDGLTAADQVISTWHPNLADGAAVAVQQ